MSGYKLVIVAVVVYALIAIAATWPEVRNGNDGRGDKYELAYGATTGPSLKSLPYRGVAMQLQRTDWVDQYKKCIDEIAALGADTVSLVVDTRQENVTSTFIYIDSRKTLTGPQLTDVITHAKQKGLRVILMPIVLLDDPQGNDWRGTIKPTDWDQWFNSYRDMIEFYAYIANNTGVDVMVVGSELVSSESKLQEWTDTIRDVRGIFHGQLTYSSNWDHYTSVKFWDQLDMIGMNSYWKLGDNASVTTDQIVSSWRNPIQKDLLPFAAKQHRPVMFLEAGWCSLANSASASWDYTQEKEPIDLDLQKRLYEGFFQAWYGNPSLAGFMMWNWEPGDGGQEDRGYTCKNKPAEQVLRDWLAKKPWTVTTPG